VCAGVSVVALHGIDARSACTPLISGRGVSERDDSTALACCWPQGWWCFWKLEAIAANIKASFGKVGDPPRQSERSKPQQDARRAAASAELCVKRAHSAQFCWVRALESAVSSGWQRPLSPPTLSFAARTSRSRPKHQPPSTTPTHTNPPRLFPCFLVALP
jgi:hypothetical protein